MTPSIEHWMTITSIIEKFSKSYLAELWDGYRDPGTFDSVEREKLAALMDALSETRGRAQDVLDLLGFRTGHVPDETDTDDPDIDLTDLA
jgi:hypothetical protein